MSMCLRYYSYSTKSNTKTFATLADARSYAITKLEEVKIGEY